MTALNSLHIRLVALCMLLLVLTGIGIWNLTRISASETAARDVDDRLRVTAVALVQSDSTGTIAPPAVPTSDMQGWSDFPAFQITDADGGVIAQTASFPALSQSAQPGLATRQAGDGAWRVFTHVDGQRQRVVHVALHTEVVAARAATIRSAVSMQLAIWLPVVALGLLVSLWLGLSPLRRIDRAVRAIDPCRPAPLGLQGRGMPRELARLASGLDTALTDQRAVLDRQRAFASAAGHELRTPLAGCRSQVDVLTRADDAATRDRAVARLSEGLDRMERLTGQLLLLARSDRAALQRECVRFDLVPLLADIAAEAGCTGLGDTQGPSEILGEPTLIRALVVNLVDNARRASPAAGSVEIGLTVGAAAVEIAVTDRGPGLTEATRARIFDSFYQAEGRAREGAGLGLSIASAVAEAHGGTITPEDQPGGGTCMRVCLPRDMGDRAAAPRAT